MNKHVYEVTSDDTAIALGSGEVPVLATPRLVAWMEAATMAAMAADLEDGETTVGVEVKIEHVKAVLVGRKVTVCAGKPVRDGRRLLFHCTAVDGEGVEVACGTIARAKVDRERFLRKAEGLSTDTATIPVIVAGQRPTA